MGRCYPELRVFSRQLDELAAVQREGRGFKSYLNHGNFFSSYAISTFHIQIKRKYRNNRWKRLLMHLPMTVRFTESRKVNASKFSFKPYSPPS